MPVMESNAPKRPPVLPLTETTRWRGQELDVYTVDRGVEHGFILSNLYVDGNLLVTRRVGYLSTWEPAQVSRLMKYHQETLLREIQGGALDEELVALFDGKLPWTVATPSPSPTPAPMPAVTVGQLLALPPPPPPPAIPANALTPTPSPATGPQQLILTVETPTALLPRLVGSAQGLRVPATVAVQDGTRVEVAVRFLGRPIHQFYVPGTVTGPPTITGEVTVMVDPADQAAVERVVDFARGVFDPTTDRKTPRARCGFPVSVTLPHGVAQPGRALNISEGGLMLGRMPPLMDGTRVTISITVPNAPPLLIPAQACWFRTDGEPLTGVQWLHEGDTQTRVAAVVAQLLKTG